MKYQLWNWEELVRKQLLKTPQFFHDDEILVKGTSVESSVIKSFEESKS